MEKALFGNRTVAAVLKYVTAGVVMLGLSGARFYGITPFGRGFFLAAAFLGLPLPLLVPLFLAAEILANPSISGILVAGVCAGVTSGAVILSQRFKARRGAAEAGAAVLSQSALFFTMTGGGLWLLASVSVALTAAFMCACLCGLKPVVREKLRYRLLETETVCLALILAAFSMGLSRLNIGGYPVICTAAAFAILLTARLSGAGAGLVCAFCFGAGIALYTYNPSDITLYVFIAAVAGIFVSAPRVLSAFAVVIAYTMYTFYFNADYSNALLSMAAFGTGAVLYILIPSGKLTGVKEYFFSSPERAAVRFMITKSRSDVGNALLNNADIFDAMSLYLHKRNADNDNMKDRLYNGCCASCDNLAICSKAGFREDLEKILDTAETKGRVTVSDLPLLISSSCVRLPRLLKTASDIDDRSRIIKTRNAYENEARTVIASQLKGVSATLKSIASRHGGSIPFDKSLEKSLIEELNYRGISCAEAVIAGDDVSLIVRTECIERAVIEKTASTILRRGYKITAIDDTSIAGFCGLSLSPRPRFNVLFGVASSPKYRSAKSGDTHSFVKLDNSRLLIALCDGMGSGEKAQQVSEAAIGLIESFYKAGFSSELVLYSVNRFLSLTSGESFSALDICIVDLQTAKADVIKLASPASYIKKRNIIRRVDGSGLPLGADDEVRPSIVTLDLEAGDTLVFTSDGISDEFDGDKLAAAVLNTNTLNPQTLAECVMEKTLDKCSGALKDDATIIAARLIPDAG